MRTERDTETLGSISRACLSTILHFSLPYALAQNHLPPSQGCRQPPSMDYWLRARSPYCTRWSLPTLWAWHSVGLLGKVNADALGVAPLG